MKHEMKLNASPFAMIKSGQKWVEMRLYDEKRRKINVNDEIVFMHAETKETLLCKVKGLCVCTGFEEIYRRYDKTALGYQPVEKADPKDMLAYYSQADVDANGAVGIELELLS